MAMPSSVTIPEPLNVTVAMYSPCASSSSSAAAAAAAAAAASQTLGSPAHGFLVQVVRLLRCCWLR